VGKNLYSLKANRPSTKKKDLIMSLRDVLIAEEQKSNKVTTGKTIITEALKSTDIANLTL
jgi:hypothetical protein